MHSRRGSSDVESLTSTPEKGQSLLASRSSSGKLGTPTGASPGGSAQLSLDPLKQMLGSTGEQPSGSTVSWLLTPAIVAAWFMVNIVLLLMNRALLSTYNFRHPICLTMMHMVACVVLSNLAQLHPGLLRQQLQSKRQAAKVATLAAVFAVTVVGGNLSLQYIPVSFNQVSCCCLCSRPVFYAPCTRLATVSWPGLLLTLLLRCCQSGLFPKC